MKLEIGDDESVSMAVIRAVSAVRGRKPTSLQPLSEVIDTDALDALFDPPSNGGPQTGRRIAFSYANCRISIDNAGVLRIEPFETTRRQSAEAGTPDRAGTRVAHRDASEATSTQPPGSRVCFVCQQPIDREHLHREGGELVHGKCRAELRCGISLDT